MISLYQRLKERLLAPLRQYQYQRWVSKAPMTLPDVLVDVVLVNWKRPKNVERIIDAFLNQSYPCRIILINCKENGIRLKPSVLQKAHVILETNQNLGGYNRYLALPALNSTYTYFHDDDQLPGERLLEHYVESARQNPDFAVLGQVGRNYNGESYNINDILPEPHQFREVNSVIQSYFVKTADLKYMYAAKEELTRAGLAFPFREDDLVLCLGLHHFLNKPCLLTPAGNPEERFNKVHLPEDYGLSHQNRHMDSRTGFVQLAAKMGWFTPTKP